MHREMLAVYAMLLKQMVNTGWANGPRSQIFLLTYNSRIILSCTNYTGSGYLSISTLQSKLGLKPGSECVVTTTVRALRVSYKSCIQVSYRTSLVRVSYKSCTTSAKKQSNPMASRTSHDPQHWERSFISRFNSLTPAASASKHSSLVARNTQ